MPEYFQMSETSWTRESTETIISAVYLGISQIQCILPDPSKSYFVSISNNGQTFAISEIIILNFDPVCSTCNFTSGICAPRVRVIFLLPHRFPLLCGVDVCFETPPFNLVLRFLP